jgi:predicted oxidoreductase (fatty acid repression mutant protein)
VNFPDGSRLFKQMPQEQAYIENIVQVTRRELESRARDETARTSILMQATDNSVWAITVSPAGAVITTKVR